MKKNTPKYLKPITLLGTACVWLWFLVGVKNAPTSIIFIALCAPLLITALIKLWFYHFGHTSNYFLGASKHSTHDEQPKHLKQYTNIKNEFELMKTVLVIFIGILIGNILLIALLALLGGFKQFSMGFIFVSLVVPLLVIVAIRIASYLTRSIYRGKINEATHTYLKDYTTHTLEDLPEKKENDPLSFNHIEQMKICYFPRVESEILKTLELYSFIESDTRYAREVDIAAGFVKSAVKLVRGFISLARAKGQFSYNITDSSNEADSELYKNQEVVIKKLNSINETLVSIIDIHTQDLVDSLDKLELPVFDLTLRKRVSDLINRSEKLISSISNENHDAGYTTEDVFILQKLVDSELENIYSLFIESKESDKDEALCTSNNILNRIDSYVTDLETDNASSQKTESLRKLLITERYFENRIPETNFMKEDRSKQPCMKTKK